MARAPDPTTMEILKKYHPNPKAALWDCHGTWVVYHKDIELMSAKAGIKFDPPSVLEANGQTKCVALCVVGHLEGVPSTWSVGEASPANNKNAYPFAMAEKRAKDRVALKLLGLHGLYSEEEADDFKNTARPEPVQDQSAQRTAYLTVAHGIIRHFKATAPDLRDWWLEETEAREKLGIVNGTTEYADLFKAFKEKGLALASHSHIEDHAA